MGFLTAISQSIHSQFIGQHGLDTELSVIGTLLVVSSLVKVLSGAQAEIARGCVGRPR